MSKPVDANHALYIGAVVGIAMRYGFPIAPIVDEDGDYTDHLRVPLGADGLTVVMVVPPPPDDWNLVEWLEPNYDGEQGEHPADRELR